MKSRVKASILAAASLSLIMAVLCSTAGCQTEIKMNSKVTENPTAAAEEKEEEPKDTDETEEMDQEWIEEQLEKGNIDNYALKFEYNDPDYFLETDRDSYQIKVSDNEGKILIIVNDTVNELDISYTDWLGVSVGNPYLVKYNGKTYIYANGHLEGDAAELNIYEADGDTVKRIDHIPYTSIWDMQTPVEFTCHKYGFMNGVFSAEMLYTVGDNGVPVPVNGEYILTAYADLFLKEEQVGYIVKDGVVTSEEKILPSGGSVTPVLTDGKSFVDVIDNEGDEIRIDCSKVFSESPNDSYPAIIDLFEIEWN